MIYMKYLKEKVTKLRIVSNNLRPLNIHENSIYVFQTKYIPNTCLAFKVSSFIDTYYAWKVDTIFSIQTYNTIYKRENVTITFNFLFIR